MPDHEICGVKVKKHPDVNDQPHAPAALSSDRKLPGGQSETSLGGVQGVSERGVKQKNPNYPIGNRTRPCNSQSVMLTDLDILSYET